MNYIKFLGTGATFPTKYRNVSAIYFNYNDIKIIMDFGEGTQKQLAKYKLDYNIDYILITHNHLDHYWGLIPFLRTLSLRNRSKPLTILGKNIREIEVHFQRVITDYKSLPYQILFLEFQQKIIIKNIEITPILVKHSIPAIGFLIEIKERERISNVKLSALKLVPGAWCSEIIKNKEIRLNNKTLYLKDILECEAKVIRLFYSGDTLPIFKKEVLNDLDIMIYECTNCDEDIDLSKVSKHTIFSDSLKLQSHYKPKSMILTHISQKLDFMLRKMKIPADLIISHDGFSMEIR